MQKVLRNIWTLVVLVLIRKLSLITLRWVPICQSFSHFSGFLHHCLLVKLATSSIRVKDEQSLMFWNFSYFSWQENHVTQNLPEKERPCTFELVHQRQRRSISVITSPFGREAVRSIVWGNWLGDNESFHPGYFPTVLALHIVVIKFLHLDSPTPTFGANRIINRCALSWNKTIL